MKAAQPGQASASTWTVTVGVVLLAGLPGLLLLEAVQPLAVRLGVRPAQLEYTAHTLAWHLLALALIATILPRVEGRPFSELVSSWWWHRQAASGRNRLALWATLLVAGAIALSPLRLDLVDAGWDVLPGPSWSINSPDANRGAAPFTIGAALVVLQLGVRIPLTVFLEETLFRGWVLGRHGAFASSLLFATYHLSQWWTIGALVPFGLVLALLRIVTRSLWPGAVGHWLGNAAYAFSLR